MNRCPHVAIRGIFGDEINHTPGFRRLQCLDCGRHLDGPVSLSNRNWLCPFCGRWFATQTRLFDHKEGDLE